ncbi:hypothetical protein C0995_002207 [Termitomyces sp. Mi166|nr:hypothetical protein C0995_002207 [Termitomyces sp. Mi166\
MIQPTAPANSSDASSPQNNAWNHLLALETQVQTIQTSLTLHMTNSLQMLLEHLPSTPVITPTPPTPPETIPAPHFNVSAAPHTKIPCPALSDTYGDQSVEFFPLDPAKTAALSLHNLNQYGQENQSLDDYIDSFHALAEQAGYPDGLQLCLTFHDGLHPTLIECIDNLAEGHPDDSIATWYKVAHYQWQLMELKHELQHPNTSHPVHVLLSCQLLIPSLLYMVPLSLHHLQQQHDLYLQESPWK